MEESQLKLFKDLILCISKHLLNYTNNESQALKLIRIAVNEAIQEENYHG